MSYHTPSSTTSRTTSGSTTQLTSSDSSSSVLGDNEIQIGDLSYDGIKTSIIDYLKREDSPLSDLDFSSSALNVLVDALAYNTMYYGFYSNMVANELYLDTAQRMESLISITKPLGFTVKAAVAARSIVNMTNIPSRIPQYSKFTGTTESGSSYNFYTLDSYEVDSETSSINQVVLYEAKDLVLRRDISNLVNKNSQTFTLADDRIDIDSIEIEVSTDGGATFSTYTKSESVNSTITSDSTVYFVERLNKGVKIIFSVRADGEILNLNNPNIEVDNVGRKILPTDKIRISYLIPSGKSANGIRKFSYTDGAGTVQLQTESYSGSDGPDPDLIRFFAPKWFAAQDRAVTRNDYLGLMKDYVASGQPNDVISVFGGEELNPPYYGRVFVSLLLDDAVTASDLLDFLREKSPLSIMPEYIPPQVVELNVAYTVFYNPLNTQKNDGQLSFAIRENVESKYGGEKFNNSFILSEFIETVASSEPGAILPENILVNLSAKIDFDIDATSVEMISFKNPIRKGAIGSGLRTSEFYSPRYDRDDVFIIDSGLDSDAFGFSPLYLGRFTAGIIEVLPVGSVGQINYKTGLIKINPNVTPSQEVTFTITPEFNTVDAKQEMVMKIIQTNVEVRPI
jgi:hypothetical protein